MKITMSPTEDWGPADQRDRVQLTSIVLTPKDVDDKGNPKFSFGQAMALASSALSLRGRLGGSTNRIHQLNLSPERNLEKPSHHRSHPSIIINEPSPVGSARELSEKSPHHRSVASLKDSIEMEPMGKHIAQTHV